MNLYLILIVLSAWCARASYIAGNLSFVDIQTIIQNYDPFTQNKPERLRNHLAIVKTKIALTDGKFRFVSENLNITYLPMPLTMWTRTRDDQNRNGPDAKALYCAPSGTHAYTDWFIIQPLQIGIFGTTLEPKTITVHMSLFQYFVDDILPLLKHKIVLVTAVTEATIPFNVDRRYELNNQTDYWNRVIESPMVIHWFAENKVCTHPKVSSIPIGSFLHIGDVRMPKEILPLSKRIPKMIVADKVHDEEAQWDDRRRSAAVCLSRPNVCVSMHGLGGDIANLPEWLRDVSQYQFIGITHGGGLDPCPKLFDSLMVGTIPIIERTALYDAYEHFPVVFVRNLTDFMTWPNASLVMERWVNKLEKYYEPGSHLRNQTLHRLNAKYWYHLIESKLYNHYPQSSHKHRSGHFQSKEFNDDDPFCETPTIF